MSAKLNKKIFKGEHHIKILCIYKYTLNSRKIFEVDDINIKKPARRHILKISKIN